MVQLPPIYRPIKNEWRSPVFFSVDGIVNTIVPELPAYPPPVNISEYASPPAFFQSSGTSVADASISMAVLASAGEKVTSLPMDDIEESPGTTVWVGVGAVVGISDSSLSEDPDDWGGLA